MEYGNQFSVTKSFYDWCIENNRMDLNDRFDEEKNGCSTKDVGYKSNLKWWFKCPRSIHDSDLYVMHFVTKTSDKVLDCRKCNSVAQVVIDKFGEEYLWRHWHKKNTLSPWDIPAGSSRTKVFVQCDEKNYHVYGQVASSFTKGIGCPYCINRKVHPNDSLAVIYPEIIKRWSDKNDKTPYEYSPHSENKVWLRCPQGNHDDYLQKISNAVIYELRCPGCSLEETSERMRGDGCHFWKGGINGENDTLRHRREYKDWRTAVYERDDYTCQCCGTRGNKLNAHHINSFADYPDIRYDVDNGITMCVKCHDATESGSFHNLYGTHSTTSSQLREYILNKFHKDIYQTNPNLLYNTNNTKLMCAV
ncbi:MAG: HNH endonuclease [Kiritimatiellae bacterium]|nr:HNH endonuclease [Kiritimatiellia bacterium]